MSGYEYVNGDFVVHTDIREGYKRFRQCNAQYKRRAVGDVEQIVFISYATMIMVVYHYPKTHSWNVKINDKAFNYSPTTTRQISKFLNTEKLPFGCADLQKAIQSTKHMHRVNDNILIHAETWLEGV